MIDVTPPGNSPLVDCGGDVRIVYDSLRYRWYVSAFNVVWPMEQRGLCVAVSNSSDPLGGWWVASMTPAGQTFDFMQLNHTQGRIVVTDTGDRPIRAIDSVHAGEGNFSNVITWPRPHPGVMVPVRDPRGTGYTYLAVWSDNLDGIVLYRNRLGLPGTEQQWRFAVPGLLRGFISPVFAPNGSFTAAASPSVTEAWFDWHTRTVWVAGTTACQNGFRACAFAAQLGLWKGNGNADLTGGSDGLGAIEPAVIPVVYAMRTLDAPYNTLWPSLAVSGNGGVVLSAMGVSLFMWPTHVATIIPSNATSIVGTAATASVQAVCQHPNLAGLLAGLPGLSCSGDGFGPGTFGTNARGPDYQECAPDPTNFNAVWCVAQYWGGNQWYHHVTQIYAP